MRCTWSKRKSFFPFILLFIFMLHMGLFALKLNIEQKESEKEAARLVVKIKKEPFKNKTQIVQSEDSESRKKTDDAFLSDKDRFFDRETKAKKNDVFHPASPGGGGTTKSGVKDLDLSDLGSTVSGDPFKKAAKDYSKQKNNDQAKNKAMTSGATNDYLKEIPLGDTTQLNTTEYKYYGFYHRIRQKLEQFWGRSIYEKANQMLQAGRRVPASEELITALEITLDHKGNIIGIRLMGTSGIKELDDAAIESFNEAGPFPNPPEGLIVNGKVTIEWGFVVNS